MAIVSLVRKNPPPEITRSGNLLTGTELWCLIVDTAVSPVGAEAQLSALVNGNAFGWMVVGVTPHPENPGLFATDFTVLREEKRTIQFDVTVSLTNDIEVVNQSRSALDADPVYDFPDVDTIVEVDVDPLTGEAIAASNGEPFFPKATRNGTDTRIIVTRNEADFDPREAKNYRSKLNKTDMQLDGRTYDARTLLLESWTGKTAVDTDGTIYYQVRYSFLYDPEFHVISYVDAGVQRDKAGRWPQATGKVENKPFKFGRNEEGDGEYMERDRQEDPADFFEKSFNVHEEIDMRFLRL